MTKERLFVNNELQDESFGIGFRSRLYGQIKNTDGTKEQIKVSLGGWIVQCRIFIDCHLIFHSKPDKIARNELNKTS